LGRKCRKNREKRNVYMTLEGKPEGKKPLRRCRRRLVDNIKMHLREIGWSGMNWIDLSQNRNQWMTLVYKAMKLRVP
jgi:hypothetical protein